MIRLDDRDWLRDAADAADEKAGDPVVRFGNLGGDPFTDPDDLEAFVDALEAAGATEVRLGDEPYGEHEGIHDRPVTVVGVPLAAAETIWAAIKDEAQGLTSPSRVDEPTDAKADPMANGHDLDPETGEGVCEATGETIEAETMADLTEDCPHCGEALSVIDAKAGEDSRRVYLDHGLNSAVPRDAVVRADEKGLYYEAEVVDSKAVPPEAVHIESRSEAPEDAEVIEGDRGGLYYLPPDNQGGEEDDGSSGSVAPGTELGVDDLEEGAEVSVMGKPMEVQAVSHTEGPNDDQTAVGFYDPEVDEEMFFFEDMLEGELEATENTTGLNVDDGGDRDLAALADEDGLLDADDLEAGDEVVIHGDRVTLDAVASDESETVVQFEKNGEDFFLYEDMIEIEAPGGGEGSGAGGDSPGEGGDTTGSTPTDSGSGPRFEEGETIESPSGEPATVTGYDESTNVVAYETADGEEMLMTADTITEDPDTGDGGVEAELEEELPVQWVNADGLDDEQVAAVRTAFEEFQEDYDLPELAVMSVTTTPPDDVGPGAGASFTPNSGRLYVNPDGLDPESKREDYEEGFIATESPEGSIVHELTHAAHFREVLDDPELNWQELHDVDFDDEEADLIAEEVSWYASTSPSELVAEVASGVQEGHEYPAEVMELYEQFGGPEVNA